jgi:DNA (cytosine-5)-methyltransferase 1
MKASSPLFLVVDLFCGAGGTSTGFKMTNGIAKVIACVNHDPIAIKSHWKNYPDVEHFEEDIRLLDLTKLIATVKYWKRRYPNALLILWASLECTNFSKAKGGQPRDADSRTLADHLERYIYALNPDYVQIENVVEFMAWGPLDDNGKPLSRKNGQDFMRWKHEICDMGYRDEWAEMNSANYGAHTSRNRLFGAFAKQGLPIVWPTPTHAKNPVIGTSLFDTGLEKWKPVEETLDFADEGESIFLRKKPLSDKTLERIYLGLLKFVAGKTGRMEFLSTYYGNGYNAGMQDSSPTLTTKDRLAFIQPKKHSYILNPSHGGHSTSIEAPCPVIVARQDKAPLYCVQAKEGTLQVPIYDTDTAIAIKIKTFMVEHGLSDITMRMLKVPELLKIQGFPEGYQLDGTLADQKKFIGNSVVPIVVTKWILALADRIQQTRKIIPLHDKIAA